MFENTGNVVTVVVVNNETCEESQHGQLEDFEK